MGVAAGRGEYSFIAPLGLGRAEDGSGFLAASVQRRLGERLRALYDEAGEAPLSDRLRDLLAQIENRPRQDEAEARQPR